MAKATSAKAIISPTTTKAGQFDVALDCGHGTLVSWPANKSEKDMLAEIMAATYNCKTCDKKP